MPQISITISDDLHKLLEELAEDSGQSKSGLAADLIKAGAYAEAEMRNKVNIFRKMRKAKDDQKA